jgi:hypothetical protein
VTAATYTQSSLAHGRRIAADNRNSVNGERQAKVAAFLNEQRQSGMSRR